MSRFAATPLARLLPAEMSPTETMAEEGLLEPIRRQRRSPQPFLTTVAIAIGLMIVGLGEVAVLAAAVVSIFGWTLRVAADRASPEHQKRLGRLTLVGVAAIEFLLLVSVPRRWLLPA